MKLVQISLATGETERLIVFDPKHAHAGTRLAHMRFNEHHAFVAESKEGSFYVIDLRYNSYRRILVGHSLMRCASEDVPVIERRAVHLQDGRPMYIHDDLLDFGPELTWFISYACLAAESSKLMSTY